MSERQDVILGAGLAGLSAAYALQQAGQDHWQVYEREDRVGGLARTLEVEGYRFDFGPHILFTIDREMEELIRDLLGDNFHAQERRAYIYHHAHDLYTRFPFQAHLYGLPIEIVKECLVGLTEAVARQAAGEFSPTNYEEWMRGFFGTGIAEHLMIPYARKIWTVEPSTMDFSWIGRRVPTPDVERIVEGAVTPEVELVGATANFWYPREGGIEPLPHGSIHVHKLARQGIALRPQIGEPGRHRGVHAQLRYLGKPRHQPFVIGQCRVGGVEAIGVGTGIRIAEQQRLAARLADLKRQVGVVARQRRSVAHRTVVHGIEPGQKAGTRRAARGGDGKVVGEGDALGHQGAQVGQARGPGQRAGQTVGAHLVNVEE